MLVPRHACLPAKGTSLRRGSCSASPRRFGRRWLLAAALLSALTACGGGGGGAERAPDGFRGTLRLQDAHLGQVAEMEPNDLPAQPSRLAPLWAGSQVLVSGTVASGPAAFGASDPVDHHLVTLLGDQALSLRLDFDDLDPVDGLANDIELAVLDGAGDTLATTRGATAPLALDVSAAAFVAQRVRITAHGGATRYRLELLAGSPTRAAATRAAVAARPALKPRAPAAGAKGRRCATSHVLARFRSDAQPSQVLDRQPGLHLERRLGSGAYCVGLPPHLVSDASERDREAVAVDCAAALARDPDVLWAEPDWLVRPQSVPDDPHFAEQWNLRVVGAPTAWDVTTGDSSIVIGVVDTGIVAHPDLEGRVVPGYDFISSSTVAGDGGGRDSDPTDEGDRLLDSGFSTWHGTHVAGIAVARQDDGYGISGVAPGCRVMPLRVIGRGGGLSSDAADAILYGAGLLAPAGRDALAEPLPILNLSLGVYQESSVLREACQRAQEAGVLLVAAVGNDGGGPPLFPAAFPSVMAVAAVDSRLARTAYSNMGDAVDIAAPGGTRGFDLQGAGWTDPILSTVLDETRFPAPPSHVRLAGTSQATPHVAAAAALLLSLDRTLGPIELRNLLTTTARDVGAPGEDDAHGRGVLQVHRAVRALQGQLGTPPLLPARLGLPLTSLRLEGEANLIELPLMNLGDLPLELDEQLRVDTVDGGTWLGASLQPSTETALSHDAVLIAVNRAVLPEQGTWFSGQIVVADATGQALGRIEVVTSRDALARMGSPLQIAVIEADRVPLFAPRTTTARAVNGYRYWVRDFPEAEYLLRGGEDQDRDGFFCEPNDRCGYHGGSTAETATALPYDPRFESGAPTDVPLVVPAGP